MASFMPRIASTGAEPQSPARVREWPGRRAHPGASRCPARQLAAGALRSCRAADVHDARLAELRGTVRVGLDGRLAGHEGIGRHAVVVGIAERSGPPARLRAALPHLGSAGRLHLGNVRHWQQWASLRRTDPIPPDPRRALRP